MFKRILVPVDGSDTSTKALVMATQLARESGGRVRVLHSFDALVYLSGFEVGPGVLEAARAYADKVLDDAMAIAKAAGVPADKRLSELPGGRLGEIVADAPTAWEADLVVVGTHGRRGVARVLLGSGLSLAAAPRLFDRMRQAGASQREWGTRAAGGLVVLASAWALWMDLAHRIALWCGLA